MENERTSHNDLWSLDIRNIFLTKFLHSLGILFVCFLLQTVITGKSLTKSMGDYELGK